MFAWLKKLTEIFLQYGQGIQTKRDAFCIAYTTAGLQERLDDLISLRPDEVADKYRVKKLSASWSLEEAMDDVRSNAGEIIRLNVRPFDTRYTYFTIVDLTFSPPQLPGPQEDRFGVADIVCLAQGQPPISTARSRGWYWWVIVLLHFGKIDLCRTEPIQILLWITFVNKL